MSSDSKLGIMSNGTSRKLKFTLKELDNLDELDSTNILAALVSRTASFCSIEFLKTKGNDVKPHVVFNLSLNPQQSQSPEPFKGCRLSMEYGYNKKDSDEEDSEEEDSDGEDSDRGTFVIKALPYEGLANRATASFGFEVNTQIAIKDWIKIFRGTYKGLAIDQQTDLTLFKFVVVDTPEDQLIDGCRDFMCVNRLPASALLFIANQNNHSCQCFLRAYHLDIVQGCSSSVSIRAERTQIIGFHKYIPFRPELGTPDSVWFFDIIDKNFKLGSNNKGDTITVVPTPMHQGVFLSEGFRRIETFGAMHYFPLNYNNQPAAQDSAGNNGQGGAPEGSWRSRARGQRRRFTSERAWAARSAAFKRLRLRLKLKLRLRFLAWRSHVWPAQ